MDRKIKILALRLLWFVIVLVAIFFAELAIFTAGKYNIFIEPGKFFEALISSGIVSLLLLFSAFLLEIRRVKLINEGK